VGWTEIGISLTTVKSTMDAEYVIEGVNQHPTETVPKVNE